MPSLPISSGWLIKPGWRYAEVPAWMRDSEAACRKERQKAAVVIDEPRAKRLNTS
ncbi:MAG: hypothetical protein ACM3UZ_13420 [Acidobacteriota bacterium]